MLLRLVLIWLSWDSRGQARLRSWRPVAALSLWIFEPGAFVADAGAGSESEPRSDVAAGKTHPGLQDCSRLSARQPGGHQSGLSRVHFAVPEAEVVWRRVSGHRREQVQGGQQSAAQLQ